MLPIFSVERENASIENAESSRSRSSSTSSSSLSSSSSSSSSKFTSSSSSDEEIEECDSKASESQEIISNSAVSTKGNDSMDGVVTSTPVPPLENVLQSTDGASQGNDSHSTDRLILQTTPKKDEKEKEMKKNVRKTNRNFGKSYQQSSKKQKDKIRPERQLKAACGEKCRFKCFEKITDEERKALFQEYWNLGDVERQRDYLAHCMSDVKPKCEYRRIKINCPI